MHYLKVESMHKLIVILLLFMLVYLPDASGDLGLLDPLARSTTPIGPGYLLSINVTLNDKEEADLCGQYPLDSNAALQLMIADKPLDKIELRGCTVKQAQDKIKEAVKGFYAVDPVVRVGIARITRIHLLVQGATFRNGPLTLPDGSHLSDALAETGYQPSADLSRVTIYRVDKGGAPITMTANFAKTLEGDSDRFTDPLMQDGDKITISLTPTPFIPRFIMVLGEVKQSGAQPYKSGMRVRDALQGASGLLSTADPQRITLRRATDNTFMSLNANKAKENIPTDNLVLQPDDTIFVSTRDSGKRYAVLGAVAAPSTTDYTHPISLKQAIIDAGGFKPDADRKSVVLIRGMLTDPATAKSIPLNYDKLASGENPDIQLGPGDVVQVMPRKKASGSPLVDVGLFLLRFFIF